MIALLCFFLTLFASPFTNGDRLFLVQLYRWFPSVLKGHRDHPTGDPHPLASRRLPSVLALEIPPPWRSTANRRGSARADPADERGKSAVGSAAHPCSTSASRSLSPASRSTWSSDVDRRPRAGAPSCVTTHRTSRPWTYSSFRPLAATCSMPSSSFGWSAETSCGSTSQLSFLARDTLLL